VGVVGILDNIEDGDEVDLNCDERVVKILN